MNKKAIIINGAILVGLGLFVVVSITFYYLIPAANSILGSIIKNVEELIRIIFK